MDNVTPKYNIKETNCYPNMWKVCRVCLFTERNDTHLYHPDIDSAKKYIEKIGGVVADILYITN